MSKEITTKEWMDQVIKKEEYEKFLDENGNDFIDDDKIFKILHDNENPTENEIRKILDKSLSITRLEPEETAKLLAVKDENLWNDIFKAALKVKQTVYGTRIVTFAPLYPSNLCVNNCLYCGFRTGNCNEKRVTLNKNEIIDEVNALTDLGHKRLIVSLGEHPVSDADYIVDALETIYSVKNGNGEIRRVNVNCAPLNIADLKKLKKVGIGTYQVFQETYHHETYKKVHPSGIKADYKWRLYSMHRAMAAGIDDMGIGALIGLFDWRFEVMGLLFHTIELEKQFNGVGPHTISFPRMQYAENSPIASNSKYKVSDSDFKKLVAVLRLSVPYTGLILTARESAAIRNDVIQVGCTQIDADAKVGIGAYKKQDKLDNQDAKIQQFILGDTRTLDEAIRDMAKLGYITGFCTACYRCNRTGDRFMAQAKNSKINHFCMPNAILTFKEYLLDYAKPETKIIGEELIKKEIDKLDDVFKPTVLEYLSRLEKGERDLMV